MKVLSGNGENLIMNKTIIYIGVFDFDKRQAAVQRVLPNAAMFSELGYRVVFVSSSGLKDKQGLNNKYSFNGYDVYSFPTPSSFKDRVRFKVSTFFIEEIIKSETPTCVIMYNYPAIAMNSIRKLCVKYHCASIADSTEWYASTGNIVDKCITAIDVYLRMNIMQKRMDGLILTSSYLMDFYKTYTGPKLQLPTLIDYSDPKWSNCAQYSRNLDDPINISTIAVLSQRAKGRGKDELFDVVSCLDIVRKEFGINNISLTVIGTTEETFKTLYGSDHDISFVKFLGRKPHEETLSIISKSDYFLFIREPNRVNMAGFPTKFSESMACGTPVITTNTSDLKEYLKNGYNGYFISGDIKRMPEEIADIITSSISSLEELHFNCSNNRSLDYKSFLGNARSFMNSITSEVLKG